MGPLKLHLVEDSQRSVKEIRERIEHYEKRNLEHVSEWPNEYQNGYRKRFTTQIQKSENKSGQYMMTGEIEPYLKQMFIHSK